MRVVRTLEAVGTQVELASNEAASAFGDPTVFCEPYIEHGRHIEVQVVGDTHGNVVVLGERDCSLQRRHQKVVEETPAPGLPDATRQALHEAAHKAAEAIAYVGAGTVEFLYDPATDRFIFLEMNTRLQVEHPVTELVTGLDLVALQLEVAEGRSILAEAGASGLGSGGGAHAAGGSHVPAGPVPQGHAIEVRLYAEDPGADWQPQSGRLARFEVPGVVAELDNPTTYGIRLDSGVESGAEVGTYYDAMLAKVIAWAPTREQAARRLAAALRRARIHGVRTNRDLLAEVLAHPAFVAGEVSTDFLGEHDLRSLQERSLPGTPVQQGLAFFAAAVAVTEQAAAVRPVQQRVPNGWRNVVSAPQTTTFDLDGTHVQVGWRRGRDGYRSADEELSAARSLEAAPRPGGWRVVVEHDGVAHPFEVFVDGDRVDVESSLGHVALGVVPRFVDPADQVATGSLLAPMPGSVVSLAVTAGERVGAGQPVLVLEAMKMQHTVHAPHDGVITELPVSVGEQVAAGAVLAVVLEQETTEVGTEGDSA